MSVIEVSDINKEESNDNQIQKDKEKDNGKEKDKEKDKDKDKEKETSNLLEEASLCKIEKKIDIDCPIEKDNEVYFFVALACFIFIIFRLTKLKLNPDNPNILNKSFIYVMETNETINNFENRYKHLYPTLNLSNEYPPHIWEVMDARILYIHESNLTNRYITHVRKINFEEEENFKKELYKFLRTNQTFEEKRDNYIDTIKFIEVCNKSELVYPIEINKTETYKIKEPAISIIIPVYNKKKEIMRSVRSIQNQSFKNIEIILVDDFSNDNITEIYDKLLIEDPRIRLFLHMKNMGTFRSRLDGFLYSRGKYILNFDAGDLLSDNYVLEDVYNTIVKYKLDSIRFSFKTFNHIKDDQYIITTHEYPEKKMRIRYGKIRENVRLFGYNNIWNRLIRANAILKGLDNVDSYIYNAYQNLWEDTWWNSLVNEVTLGYTTINRVGYVYFPSEGEGKLKIETQEQRDYLIKEFINFWLFEFETIPKDDKKKRIINNIRQYSMPNNTYYGIPVNLDYLNSNFTPYFHLLDCLLNDVFVDGRDKDYIGLLINNFTLKYMNKIYYVNESDIVENNNLINSIVSGNNTLNNLTVTVNNTLNNSNIIVNNNLSYSNNVVNNNLNYSNNVVNNNLNYSNNVVNNNLNLNYSKFVGNITSNTSNSMINNTFKSVNYTL